MNRFDEVVLPFTLTLCRPQNLPPETFVVISDGVHEHRAGQLWQGVTIPFQCFRRTVLSVSLFTLAADDASINLGTSEVARCFLPLMKIEQLVLNYGLLEMQLALDVPWPRDIVPGFFADDDALAEVILLFEESLKALAAEPAHTSIPFLSITVNELPRPGFRSMATLQAVPEMERRLQMHWDDVDSQSVAATSLHNSRDPGNSTELSRVGGLCLLRWINETCLIKHLRAWRDSILETKLVWEFAQLTDDMEMVKASLRRQVEESKYAQGRSRELLQRKTAEYEQMKTACIERVAEAVSVVHSRSQRHKGNLLMHHAFELWRSHSQLQIFLDSRKAATQEHQETEHSKRMQQLMVETIQTSEQLKISVDQQSERWVKDIEKAYYVHRRTTDSLLGMQERWLHSEVLLRAPLKAWRMRVEELKHELLRERMQKAEAEHGMYMAEHGWYVRTMWQNALVLQNAFANWKHYAHSTARMCRCVTLLSDAGSQRATMTMYRCLLEWQYCIAFGRLGQVTPTPHSRNLNGICDRITEELAQSQQDHLSLLQKLDVPMAASKADLLESYVVEAAPQRQQTIQTANDSNCRHLEERVAEMQFGCEEMKEGCQMAEELLAAEVAQLGFEVQLAEECKVQMVAAQEKEELMESEMEHQRSEIESEMQKLKTQHDREVKLTKGRARAEVEKQKTARADDQKSFAEQQRRTSIRATGQESDARLKKLTKELREASEKSTRQKTQIDQLEAENQQLRQAEESSVFQLQNECRHLEQQGLDEINLANRTEESLQLAFQGQVDVVINEVEAQLAHIQSASEADRRSSQEELECARNESMSLEDSVRRYQLENSRIVMAVQENAEKDLHRMGDLHVEMQALKRKAEQAESDQSSSSAECQAVKQQFQEQSMMLQAEVNLLFVELQDAARNATTS